MILTLAIYLEMWIGSGAAFLNPFIFGDYGVKPDTTKAWVRKVIKRKVFKTSEFRRVRLGKIGTHSLRKYSSTWMRRHGASRDDANARGRWASDKKQVNTYIDLVLPFVDAKCASILSIGGPCKYVLKEGSNVSDAWLFEHVVPNIYSRLEGDIAGVLARALLWAAFDNEMSAYVPTEIRNRIQHSYFLIPDGLTNENPVKKIGLVVTGSQQEEDVHIDEIPENYEEGAGEQRSNNRSSAATNQQLTAIQGQFAEMRRENMEQDARRTIFEATTKRKL
jgi:hypothetical protein